MARTPSMSPAECEAILGPRGKLFVTADNVHTARKWLTANGVPGMYAAGLARAAIAAIYNDSSNAQLDKAKAKAAEANSEDSDTSGATPMPETPAATTAPAPTAGFGNAAKPVTPDMLAAVEMLRQAFGAAQTPSIDADKVRAIIRDELPNLIPVTRLEIVTNGQPKDMGEAIRHRLFPYALACVMAGIPLLLVGPAGSSKTTTAEQIAKALELRFFMQGAASGSHEYLGYGDGAGKYHTTPWRECFENGGLMNAAELDSGSPDVPLTINNGLANGHMSFPDSPFPVMRHESFRIVADANTYGHGADRTYVGRTQLDGATIDRFAVLDWGYDEAMELAIAAGVSSARKVVSVTPNPNVDTESWVRRVQALRAGAAKEKARIIISPRASIYGVKLLAAGIEQSMVESMVIWKGADADIRRRIEAHC